MLTAKEARETISKIIKEDHIELFRILFENNTNNHELEYINCVKGVSRNEHKYNGKLEKIFSENSDVLKNMCDILGKYEKLKHIWDGVKCDNIELSTLGQLVHPFLGNAHNNTDKQEELYSLWSEFKKMNRKYRQTKDRDILADCLDYFLRIMVYIASFDNIE